MKSIVEAEAQGRFDEILEGAQRQPIVIMRQGRDIAVVVSIATYESRRRENIQASFRSKRDLGAEVLDCRPNTGFTFEHSKSKILSPEKSKRFRSS